AVRRALGASSGRLARQLLTENLVLAVAGGVVGVVLAFGGLQLLQTLGRSLPRTDLTPGVSIPRLDEIAIDLPVLAFTMSITAVSTLLFGLVPAVRQSTFDHTEVLHGGAAAPAGFSLLRQHRVQGLLVVMEISAAMLLLVGGGL